MSGQSPKKQREYFREWYQRKKNEDPEYMARRLEKLRERYANDADYRAALLEYGRELRKAKRLAAGLPLRNGRGSIVPIAEQRERANAKTKERYHNDPDFRAMKIAATIASRKKSKANETPEQREHRLALRRVVQARYNAKRKARREA